MSSAGVLDGCLLAKEYEIIVPQFSLSKYYCFTHLIANQEFFFFNSDGLEK